MAHFIIDDDGHMPDDRIPHYRERVTGEAPPNRWDDMLAELALVGYLVAPGWWRRVPADVVGTFDYASSGDWAGAVRQAHDRYRR